MRPCLWVTLLVFVVIAAGIRGHSTSQRAAARKATPTGAGREAPPSWVVTGEWSKTQDEAIDSALEKAQAEVQKYLRGRAPSLTWTLPVEFVRERLLTDLRLEEVKAEPRPERDVSEGAKGLLPINRNSHQMLEEERYFPDPLLGQMRRVHLKVELNTDDYGTIRRFDSEYRQQLRQVISQQRQLLLAKALAVVVAMLVALIGYFRLEEATRGYYTAWLRLAAVGLVAAVVAGLLIVA
jgi:hypothetical protein